MAVTFHRMAVNEFEVVVSTGDMRPSNSKGVIFPHRWTPDGVVVESVFTGAHLLHLSIAGCVLNDLYREAADLDVDIDGARVTAWGDFDRETWQSTGVEYNIEISSESSKSDIERLLGVVDDVAEIPKALRAEAVVRRT